MQIPTSDEIKRGYDGITADGRHAEITTGLSLLVGFNPQLQDTLYRLYAAAIGMKLAALTTEGGEKGFQGMLCGALIYGLHLGLHIGEARGKDAT